MATRDSGKNVRGMNNKGKTVKLPNLKPAGKPTEAITAKGKKAKGLGKSTKENRFASSAKTPVKSADKGFTGSGSPLGTSLKLSQPTKKSNIINAVGAATIAQGQLSKAAGWVTNQAIKEALGEFKDAASSMRRNQGPFKSKPDFSGASKEAEKLNQTKAAQAADLQKKKVKKKKK